MVASRDTYRIVVELDIKDKRQLKDLEQNLKAIGKSAPAATGKLNKGLRQTQIEMRRTGRGFQNFSYQAQDLIVQISGGVDVFRSLSQQLPQLFINMGKVGAAIGLASAAVPLLIQAFIEASDAAMSLDEATEELSGGMSSLDEAAKRFLKTGSELDKLLLRVSKGVAENDFAEFVRSLNEDLDPSSLRVYIGLIGDLAEEIKNLVSIDTSNIFDIREGSIADEAIKGWQEWLGFLERFSKDGPAAIKETELRLKAVSNEFNVSAENAKVINAVLEDLEAENINAAQAVERLGAALGNLQSGFTGEGLRDLITSIRNDVEGMNAANDAANNPLAGMVDNAKKSMDELEDFISVRATRIRSNMANMALPIEERALIEQFEEDRAALNDFSNNVVNEFSVAGEAISIFTSTSETALNGLAMGTQSLSDAFTNMVKSIIAQLGKLLALKGIEMLFPSLQGMLVSPQAKGNAFMNGSVTAFAKGGVVSSPTIFPMAKGVGLMGEAGPEAVMPLTRTSSGNLGVEATGMNVTVNNMSPAQIRTTQTDDGLNIDVIMDTIASAVQRGGNNVADALESTYPISRGARVY